MTTAQSGFFSPIRLGALSEAAVSLMTCSEPTVASFHAALLGDEDRL